MKTLFKKLFIIFTLISTLAFIPATSVFADDAGFSGGACDRGFLGLVSWDCNVEITDETSLKSGIWTIVANIITDVVIIAAYLVIGYVIYGGYLYIFSGMDPNKVTTGKKTLARAFIGLAIVMSANVIMGAIRIALAGSANINECVAINEYTVTNPCGVDTNQMVINLIQWVIGIAGAVAAIFVVYGGIAYITSSGDVGKLQKAKSMILYALIGLAIVALAEVITAFVSNMIRDANNKASSSAYYINKTITEKEIHEII